MIRRAFARVRGSPLDVDVLLLTVLCLPALAPLFAPGYVATHDGLFHLFRLVELDSLWKGGELYPRLAPDLALGYDYPVFNYYAPLALYAGELLRLLGLSATDAVKTLLGLSIVGSAWSMRLFLDDLGTRRAAIVGALAYAYLPYLLLDVYVRGALAEALAMAVLPLVLWTIRHLVRRPGFGSIGLASAVLAGLILTHNVTAMLALPLIGGYWVLFMATERPDRERRQVVAASAAALLLGLTLSSFFWVPALGEASYVSAERATTGFFDFHQHLQRLSRIFAISLTPDYHTDFSLLFRVGLVQLGLAGGGLGCALASAPGRRRVGVYWGCAVLIGLFLIWTGSVFVWETVPLLAYAQFPWRLLAIVGFGSSVLAGQLAGGIRPVRPPTNRAATGANARRSTTVATLPLPLGLLWAGGLAAAIVVTAVPDVRPDRLDLRALDARPPSEQQLERAVNSIAGSPGEYLPRGANPAMSLDSPGDTAAGNVRLTVRSAGPFLVDADVSADQPSAVTLDRFYFPG